MENRNFLVLDGGLGSALIRAGFDIDVSNYDTFFILLMPTNSFSVQLRETHLLCMQLSHTISHKLVYMNRAETCMRSKCMGMRGNLTSQCLVGV